jgi:hypothetical protein
LSFELKYFWGGLPFVDIGISMYGGGGSPILPNPLLCPDNYSLCGCRKKRKHEIPLKKESGASR